MYLTISIISMCALILILYCVKIYTRNCETMPKGRRAGAAALLSALALTTVTLSIGAGAVVVEVHEAATQVQIAQNL